MPSPENSQITIPLVIISPFTISAAALQALLLANSQFKVLGTYFDIASSLETFRVGSKSAGECSTVILIDLESENELRIIIELMATPLAQEHRLRILVLTGNIDEKMHDAALTAGASGLVRKTDSTSTLFKAIACVAAGELWLDRATTGRIFQALARKKLNSDNDPEQGKIETLTRKERVIISEIASMPSASGQELAARLNISEHTLRNHLSAIYAKLGVANRTALYAYARQHPIKVLPSKLIENTSSGSLLSHHVARPLFSGPDAPPLSPHASNPTD